MFPRRFTFLLVAYLALVGYLFVVWLPTVVSYERLAEKHPQLAAWYLGAIGLGAVLLAALSIWVLGRLWRNTLGKHRRVARRKKNPSQMSAAQQRAELAENLATSRGFAGGENVSDPLREEIVHGLQALETKQSACRLEIVAFGTISSGKSTLLNALAGRPVFASDVVGGTTSMRSEIPWPGSDEVVLVDTPGLAEVRGESRAAEAAAAAKNADLVLLVVDGPLKDYEVELARQLSAMEKRLVVCLNKEDWYDADDQQRLLRQITDQLSKSTGAEVVAVRSRAASRTRVHVAADGTEAEEQIELPPDVRQLAERMMQIVQQDGRELLLANLLLQSRALVDEAKDHVRAVLDARADEIISRHMWAAGSAAGVNPIPLLDLAGGSAITVKMVLDLARVYQQPIDADTITKLLEQLGKNLVAMIGATAATPAVASGVASMLKTVPGIGTLAGGLIQGLVQALLTRWIGRVFVVYFQQEMKPSGSGLAELARDQWQQLTQPDVLRKLIQLGRHEIDSPADEERP